MYCALLSVVLKRDPPHANQVIRFTTAPFDVQYPVGTLWQATGDMLSIGEYESTYDITTQGIKIELSGVDPSYLEIIEKEGAFRNSPTDVLIADVPDGTNVASSATYYHRGLMDTPTETFDYESNTIQLSAETRSIFRDIERTPEMVGCSYSQHSARHILKPEPNNPDSWIPDEFFKFTSDVGFGEEVWKK